MKLMENKYNLSYIDSLRGIAAIIVIMSHSFLYFIPSVHTGNVIKGTFEYYLYNSSFAFFYKGSSSVYLFFILSGFVLSYSCLIKFNEINYLRIAINKRFLRLAIPVSGSILISYFLMNMHMFSYNNIDIASPLVNAYSKTPGVAEFIKSFFYESIIFGDSKFNYVLWTINIELFGSFFVYFLLISIGNDIRKIRFTSFVILILSLLLQDNTFIIYMGLFSVGIFISTYTLNKPNKIYSRTYALLLIAFGLYLWGYSWNSVSYEYLANLLTKIQNEFNLVIYWSIITPS